jgi:hypothetical protein
MIFERISKISSTNHTKFELRKPNYDPKLQHGQKPPLLRKLEYYNPKIRKGIFKWLKFTAFMH